MPINFSNTNSVWASVLVETLYRLGVTTAVICPGSRSAPLAVAFAQHQEIEAIPVLDERSASFFALGLARRSGVPTALVCTSGTAGANFYPAVIEARESRVPLLVLTADRPPELRDCNAGQTVDQQKLYGNFPNWYSELAAPALDLDLLAYLRQTIAYAWERSLYPVAGPVHLNLPFRDPLAPIPQPEAQTFAQTINEAAFFEHLSQTATLNRFALQPALHTSPPAQWLTAERGLIIAGPAQPRSPKNYCHAIAHLSKVLGFPVLAEGLSPLRNYADLSPYLISTYDLILRNPSWATSLVPEVVIRIGEMPTSKVLRTWLATTQPRQWIVDEGDRNLDPTHGKTVHLRLSVEELASEAFLTALKTEKTEGYITSAKSPTEMRQGTRQHYCDRWCDLEAQTREWVDRSLQKTEPLFEGKVAWLLSQQLPANTPLFIANSMPVRDVEYFWCPGNRAVRPYFNRGANGIDGTLSTALGIAHRSQPSIMLTGDLALLHDTNGLLLTQHIVGHLTILLINNNGGGIFEMLPISQFNPPFEQFFATPQSVNFAALCAAYQVEHELITTWEHLSQRLDPLPSTGIRVLELVTDRAADAKERHRYFELWRSLFP